MGNHVLDNRKAKVADYLRRNLAGAAQFGVVSAYFSVYGYELLTDTRAYDRDFEQAGFAALLRETER